MIHSNIYEEKESKLFKKTCFDRKTLGTLNLLLINTTACLILIYSGVFYIKRRHMNISTTGCQLFHKLISLRKDTSDQTKEQRHEDIRKGILCKGKLCSRMYWVVNSLLTFHKQEIKLLKFLK